MNENGGSAKLFDIKKLLMYIYVTTKRIKTEESERRNIEIKRFCPLM